ncbi:hypothetical protein BKA67DRAFT_544068 [Truncatella angustata]|uniref:Uncharacterized protein n=1 Tax=Truncatella angustata TaxID=152316 RepID=A0A9P9A2E2_9PEZI|nr:uncharacterized protein BKA67DRAFT_544068 [Truncatella angustata]KAH6659297.1 hypothetical protein BKA67DRAFT_544068 [Truncatella angustata]
MYFTVYGADLANTADKVVLITGGSSGIGLATVQLLLSLSPRNRVATLDRTAPPASLTSSISPDRLFFHQFDLTSWTAQGAGFKPAVTKFQRVDAGVAGAGINERRLQSFTDQFDDGQLQEPDNTVMHVTLSAVADAVKAWNPSYKVE